VTDDAVMSSDLLLEIVNCFASQSSPAN